MISDPTLLDQNLTENMEENITMRIVLLGKTGAGKSSLASTLFGGKVEFKVNHSPNSGTKSCQTETLNVNGRELCLIDTPGFFDTEQNNTEMSPEHLQSIMECSAGVHAFLIVLKVEKFTLHEKQVVDEICKQFSEEALKYSTVVFTHGDQLPEEMGIEEWVGQNEGVRNLVQKCGGRCHVIDNKHWKNTQDPYRNNQFQVEELLKTIEKTVRENGGGCYTNENLQKVQEEIQKEAERIKTTSPGDVSPEEIQKKAKEIVFKNLWPKIKGAPIGVGLGLLVGAAAVPLSIFFIPGPAAAGAVSAVALTAAGGIGGAAGRIFNKKTEPKKED